MEFIRIPFVSGEIYKLHGAFVYIIHDLFQSVQQWTPYTNERLHRSSITTLKIELFYKKKKIAKYHAIFIKNK